LNWVFHAGEFSAVLASASVIALSSFGDVQAVRIVSAVPSAPPATVVHRNRKLYNIIFFYFHDQDRIES